MIECDECKKWLHYGRTDLPQYMLSSLAKGHRKYSYSSCFKIKGILEEYKKKIKNEQTQQTLQTIFLQQLSTLLLI